MAKFNETSEERRKEVLASRHHVILIDRSDERNQMHFECGIDQMFFLTFVNLNLYKVVIDGATVDSDFPNF